MALSTNKYASVVSLLERPVPSWITDVYDQQRVAAYDGWEDMYLNVPETFKLVLRGVDDKAIYVPSAKKIVEAVNRYLGKGWSWSVASVNPDASAGAGDQATVLSALSALFTREQMMSKFFSIKRNMVVRGDAVWHVFANMALPAGQRISIVEVDPRNFFRIHHPNNIEAMTGCYLVDLIYADDGTTQIARRQEYRYNEDGTILSRLTFWEPGGWDDRWTGHPPLKPVPTPESYSTDPAWADVLKGVNLPAAIRSLPVYHIKNNRKGGDPFGLSEISGLETLVAGINQGVTDEDLTLALQGLGIYVTDSEPPQDADGQETEWVIQPGYVLEMRTPGSKFERVQGLQHLVPFQQHLDYLGKGLQESAGLSAVAIGQVDVQVAQSGVALRLEMAPILANNEEKEVELLSVMDQMLFDLVSMWLPLDGVSVPPGITVVNSFSDPLPLDRDAIVKETIALVTAGLMSKAFAIQYLQAKLGFTFPADMLAQIVSEQDTLADRMLAEATGSGLGGGANEIGQATIGDAGDPASTGAGVAA